jgi:DNA-binding NtrC family response regulator
MTAVSVTRSAASPGSSEPARLLIVDDDEIVLSNLTRFLETHGYEIHTASSAQEALKQAGEYRFDLLLADLGLPDMDGIEMIRRYRESQRDGVVLVMCTVATIDSVLDAIQMGVFDYVLKPLRDLDHVRQKLLIALEYRRLTSENQVLWRENQALRGQVKTKYKFEGIIAHSERMQQVLRLVEKVADADSTALILGESGTGKELVARAIHYNSPRRNNLLVPVNCSAIPETLLESELFGHVKGAFTGAISSRIGRFQLADGGTIFLDEIGDMPSNLQVRLLRVLQEHEFNPVGATHALKVNVRVIAATNQNLEVAVREKRFREDLYYRLNVIPIRVPALRDRPDDVRALAEHFLEFHNREKGMKVKGISQDAWRIMAAYDWPGNVRELENVLERTVIMKGEGEIGPQDLPDRMRWRRGTSRHRFSIEIPSTGIPFNDLVRKFEDDLILQALEKTRWNKNRAAALLQLNRTTLVEKIKKKQLKRTSPSSG